MRELLRVLLLLMLSLSPPSVVGCPPPNRRLRKRVVDPGEGDGGTGGVGPGGLARALLVFVFGKVWGRVCVSRQFVLPRSRLNLGGGGGIGEKKQRGGRGGAPNHWLFTSLRCWPRTCLARRDDE